MEPVILGQSGLRRGQTDSAGEKTIMGEMITKITSLFGRFGPKLRKCRKLPHFLEKENDSRSGQIKESVLTARRSLCTQSQESVADLANDESQAPNIILSGQCKDNFKSIPKPTIPNHKHSQTQRIGKLSGRTHSCPRCSKEFKYYSNLKSHWEIIHKQNVDNLREGLIIPPSADSEGLSFQCKVCSRVFKYASNLRTHRLVHTGQEEHKD